jgi:hypothetical protein
MDITELAARQLLAAPSGQRPRILADIVSGQFAGQTVTIRSVDNLEQHGGTIGKLRVSETTLSDIIVKGVSDV